MKRFYQRRIRGFITVLSFLGLAGCANVPQEVVDLSNVMGEDLNTVHESYQKLVHQHFDDLRAQRQNYLDNVWIPAFIKAWIANGHLVNIATSKEIYSVQQSAFIKPTPGQEETELLDSVRMWAHGAIAQIEKKKGDLLTPLDTDEKALTAAIDDAFAKLFRGNAAITAHLNSLRKVQGAQDDVLKALNLKDMREKINKGLADASTRAQEALTKIQAADQKALDIQSQFKTDKEKAKEMVDKLIH